MSEFLIRNGTVVDGTGAAAFRADVRIRDGRIAELAPGLKPGPQEQVIDASGCFVSPGFIEGHTHFDGAMWWEPTFDPLPGYGVTTTIFGNCGFSAAPVHKDENARLEMVKIFSFFEDIPIGPFVKDVPWNWTKWSEYQRSLTQTVKSPVNYAAFAGHIALRLAVLGMEAWDRAATADEIKQMAALLDDALKSGALGMSTNLMDHDGQDRPVPTLKADDAEFAALIDVLDRYPGTQLQVIADTFMRFTAPQTMERLGRLCAGKRVRVQWAGVPTLQFQANVRDQLLEQHEQFKKDGRDFWTSYTHTSPSSTLSVYHSLIFAQSNDYVWHEVVMAKTEEEKRAILVNPEWRARARKSWDNDAWKYSPLANPQTLYLFNSDNEVGPVNITLAEYAKSLGLHASDAFAEWLLKNGLLSTLRMAPFPLDEALVVRLMKDPYTVGNLSDAGAHGQMMCGSGENMVLFTKYVKQDKTLTVEEAVHVQTGKLAKHFNLADRGEIKVGKRADITVFNIDEIDCRELRKVFDVPDGKGGNTWRWTRDAAPVRLTLVNGTPTFIDGHATDARPGQMVAPKLNS